MWSECLYPPPPTYSYIEILTSKVMVLGGGTFGWCLDHDGGALMNGISIFINGTPESFPSPSAIEDMAPRNPAMLAPYLGLPSSGTVCCLSHTASGGVLVWHPSYLGQRGW